MLVLPQNRCSSTMPEVSSHIATQRYPCVRSWWRGRWCSLYIIRHPRRVMRLNVNGGSCIIGRTDAATWPLRWSLRRHSCCGLAREKKTQFDEPQREMEVKPAERPQLEKLRKQPGLSFWNKQLSHTYTHHSCQRAARSVTDARNRLEVCPPSALRQTPGHRCACEKKLGQRRIWL